MSESTGSTQPRRVLLPDDEDWLAQLMGMEEPLLMQLALNSRAAAEGREDVWEMPADLDGAAVHDAFGRLYQALPAPLRHTAANTGRSVPDSNRPAGTYTLYAPDGRYEYTPLYPADVDPDDVAVLAAALAHFRTALEGTDGTDLADFLQQMADEWSEPGRRREPDDGTRLVDSFAHGLAVLQLPHQPDTEQLLDAVAATAPGSEAVPARIVLTEAQNDAYQRFMTRVSAAVTEGRHDYALHRYATS
ncbi:hypothetical protein [Streptomyces silvensis]|uniref:Uncharacterized protein n=1 Tax=Streptomyces silvensis TaxID=1765722 RepID=A0A0W7X400_9ACTN|nr:hypothetical protein [Streptomyces silvensis]KUF17410.1 hypothetical protein AT728_16560 [Streptomyces silvensis]